VTTAHRAPASPRATRREWAGLAVLGLPTMLLSLDISVLFLALPHLSVDLGATTVQQLWITDSYGFLIAGFLVTMGTLGDRVGRRRLLMVGAAAFAAASVLAAFSVTPQMLIVSRALLGVAGAAVVPSTLALISTMFKDPRQLGTAMAVWMTAFMGGIALGPVVGGLLLQHFWWGAVFLTGVPVMALLLMLAPTVLPEHRGQAPGKLDLVSVVLSLLAILPVVYGLKELARRGWTPEPLVVIVAGSALGVVFVRRQLRLRHPLLDVRLFGIRTLRAALVVGLLVGSLQSGTALLVALHLQVVEGLSPVAAGLWLVPPAVALIVGINLAPVLAARTRPAYVLAGGLMISVAGQLMLTRIGHSGALVLLVTALSVVYVGVGPAAALINQLAMGATPPEHAGSTAAIMTTGGEFGVAFGIAALGSIAALIYTNRVTMPAGVTGAAADTARESVTGAAAVAGRAEPLVGAGLLDSATDAYSQAVNTVALVCALVFAVLVVHTLVNLRHLPPIGAPERTGQGAR
jgi:DHA2 family multidrug resistance protein-like MFS transporter